MNVFDRIIHFSIYHKLVIGFFTLVLVAWGIYSAVHLPIDAQPDITNNQVQISTNAPTLGAQEVEQYITAPIELSLANIPRVIESRSISRSGLSVITIVFDDGADIFWARQQVAERLKEAEAEIPHDAGTPVMSPISTGLGEIYQYVIKPKPGYENKYTATDLRTIQDWLVTRQLAGTPGVAEINGWGGFVKQYEVAVDNERLNAMNVTIPELFTALQNNNENAGGSYIEQQNNAYFIRGLGKINSLADIEKIVIRNVNGVPVLVRDVARVQYGAATRYGAVTYNGKGEVVAGVVLMLKGENFNEVIKRVKARIVQIERSLPEGIVIEPFIDRTELVGRAISTVEHNLIEGALIVVFVLVLLLGNLRAGLIVASVIPLAMLFAIAMMRLFGVSGNLMSLGAIDFGLIVDGAVIIVEATLHHLYGRKDKKLLTSQEMNEEVYQSASKIRTSAAFGEIIILIVYLPILALVGIEGKMFRPMAETVAFAILGAFILSLTYVPMISALVLSRKTEHKRSISDRIMEGIQRIYLPVLNASFRIKALIVAASVLVLVITYFVFKGLGGEFIPTLEEGDFALEMRLGQGTSLSNTIELYSKAEAILKQAIPEIKTAVTRIGTAEIPTDPMPMEGGDMMLAMKPKEEWTTASTQEEMIGKIEKAVAVIPGLAAEVSQPMQMRFNELISGIKQDVAIKIFGDDVGELVTQSNRVAALIGKAEGVTEPYVEKVTGLPQILVEYNRDKIAQYGLSISDVNMVLKTAYAGNVAGVVFEGEKRFNMVIRLTAEQRHDMGLIQNLYIPLSGGGKIPLSEVATVSLKNAPAQTSRENGKRRIFVGFNIRGRDVESVVKEIQALLAQKLHLPAGYYITYGGQFENLQAAKQRLSIAVPVALLLIIILLYFTFHSIKQALLIFTAVPLSAIGGVFALLIRDMPFSISAGVGFIALFGVAVLNGIVLIGQFNRLKDEGVTDIYERVRQGALIRLRPVIMTASVASLGFLPMALSASAGAEVQKPLATVVIGGLITATLLTLIVLPVLYILFSREGKKSNMKRVTVIPLFAVLAGASLFTSVKAGAQVRSITLQSAVATAVQHNLQVKSAGIAVQQRTALQATAYDIPRTDVVLQQDAADGGSQGNSIGVIQAFSLPVVYKNQSRLLDAQTRLSKAEQDIALFEITRQVKLAYNNFQFSYQRRKLFHSLDSIYSEFRQRAELRQKVGETSNLEKYAAQSKYYEIQLQIKQTTLDLQTAQIVLQKLLNTQDSLEPADSTLVKIPLDFLIDTSLEGHPQTAFYRQQLQVANAEWQLEKTKRLPDLNLGYYHQFLVPGFDPAHIGREYTPGTRIAGFQVGLSVPLFYGAQRARINAARINTQLVQTQAQAAKTGLQAQYLSQYNEYLKQKEGLDYYEQIGLQQTDKIIRISQVSYRLGEIGYVEYIQNLSMAFDTRLKYLDALNQYNQAIIQLNYITGGQ
ncbi:CusA/CzcA family heavy metal efflux RND transporter [Sediminibacterium soli]|uniref:CusA/CzcA family heavy metal efflux RND transporter n=1 Tax=Sediminibacterium soli TaxID=2698829 RepID=UPI00137B6BD7|nr:CusA/CzcA family heavy metal efflux RND transporter [Sediminibacterium soli]NCI47418.1 CusA/CzcA family heavy metal efflux RND transporter [Sediminibacterium soli]